MLFKVSVVVLFVLSKVKLSFEKMTPGGTEDHLNLVLKYFPEFGVDCTFLTGTEYSSPHSRSEVFVNSGFYETVYDAGVEVINKKLNAPVAEDYFQGTCKFIHKYFGKSMPGECVYGRNLQHPDRWSLNLAMIEYSRCTNTPSVFSTGDFIDNRISHEFQRATIEAYDSLIVASDPIKKQMKEIGVKKHIKVIHNGFEVSERDTEKEKIHELVSHYKFNPEERLIIWPHRLLDELKNLNYRKGIVESVKAYSKISSRHRNTKLVILGVIDPGDEEIAQRKLKSTLGALPSQIIFAHPKHCRRDYMPAWYLLTEKSKGIGLAPTYSEGYGRAHVELAAYGVPEIVTDDCGAHKLLRGAVRSIRIRDKLSKVAHKDIENLIAGEVKVFLDEILSSDELWEDYSVKGRARFMSRGNTAQKSLRKEFEVISKTKFNPKPDTRKLLSELLQNKI